jgi:hypothetical protein
MGTLHDQRPRLEIGLDAGYREIWAWVHKYMGVDEPRNVTPEQWQAAAAVVRTALAIQSADILDEQFSGAVMELAEAIQSGSSA